MSIKPPINCPPNYSILSFRMTECKKAGVVKGIETLASLDLSQLAIPVQDHNEGTLTLKANTTKPINIDDLADFWPMYESYTFNSRIIDNPGILSNGTSHSYVLYDYEEQTELLNITFTVDSTVQEYQDFETSLQTISQLTAVSNLVSINYVNSNTTGIFSIGSMSIGTKYRHIFTFDTGSLFIGPLPNPGSLTTSYTKYPNGAIKYILVYPQFDNVDASTCGCADASGDIKTNQRYIQYAGQKEYLDTLNTVTPIILDPGVLGANTIQWDDELSKDHLNYYANIGDMITTVEAPLYRGIITDINGYTITLDNPLTMEMTSTALTMKLVKSPATVNYKTVSDYLFHSGSTDVVDADFCYTETIVLKNPHSFDVPIKYMIGR